MWTLFSLTSLTSLIPAALNFAAPILQGAVGFLGWYGKEMWDGLKTMASNLSTFVVLGTCVVIASVVSANTFQKEVSCDNTITKSILKHVPSISDFKNEH